MSGAKNGNLIKLLGRGGFIRAREPVKEILQLAFLVF